MTHGCVAAGCAAGVDFSSLLAWVAEVQLRYSTNEVAQVRAVHSMASRHSTRLRACNTSCFVMIPGVLQ
jgi:hypothetical protein